MMKVNLLNFDLALFPFSRLLPICKAVTSSFITFNQELGHQVNHLVIKNIDGLLWKSECVCVHVIHPYAEI